MSKKIMLLALSVVSAALFALPAAASANPAHINAVENFSISGSTATTLEATNGEKIICHSGVGGTGSFQTTTTGTINLTFNGCTSLVFGFNVHCQAHGGATGNIVTTSLPFHLIDLGTHAGVLITPGPTNHFATFTCAGVTKTVTGNGVIGTITSPTCGGESKTPTLSFEQGATTGLQKHTTYTGVNYHLMSGGNKAAQIGVGSIHFNAAKKIDCTT